MKRKILMFFLLTTFSVIMFVGNGFVHNRMLFHAIADNDYEAAKQSLGRGAFVNCREHLIGSPEFLYTNPTPLITACKKGDQALVELLLSHGADINKADSFTGKTPLLAALHGTKENRFALAFYLIEHGANIHTAQDTTSPLYETLLVLESDPEQTVQDGFLLFQYLLLHDADTTVYMSSENLLTFAAHHRNYNVVKFLIENEYYDVDIKDSGGNSALIVSAKYNQVEIVKLLLSLGANKALADSNGLTAYDHAQQNNYSQIIALLE